MLIKIIDLIVIWLVVIWSVWDLVIHPDLYFKVGLPAAACRRYLRSGRSGKNEVRGQYYLVGSFMDSIPSLTSQADRSHYYSTLPF